MTKALLRRTGWGALGPLSYESVPDDPRLFMESLTRHRTPQGNQLHTGVMDDALPWVAAVAVATVLGIIAVVMILAARAGGWLRERWTKRRLRQEDQP